MIQIEKEAIDLLENLTSICNKAEIAIDTNTDLILNAEQAKEMFNVLKPMVFQMTQMLQGLEQATTEQEAYQVAERVSKGSRNALKLQK